MHFRIAASLIALCATAQPLAAHAAGFYLQEQSVSQQGSAFAGAAANPTDASTIFFNPAGITEVPASVTGGISVIVPRLHFNNTGSTAGPTGGPFAAYGGNNGGNPFDPTPIPSMYGVYPLNEQVTLGLGISSPFGLANEYNGAWFGRYDSTKSELMTINIAPVIAVKVTDRISIGGGPNIQYANATLENALPCPALICGGGAFTTATDGYSRLKGDSWGVGFNLGVLAKVTDSTQVGVHYRSQINQMLDGTATVSGLAGPLAVGNGTRGVEAELKQPDILSVGITQKVNERLKLLGSYNWFGWSNYDEIRVQFDGGGPDSVTPQNYDDSFSIALGAEWKQNEQWTFRTGLQYDQTPTTLPDRGTRTPDADRIWASVGASLDLDSAVVDFAASHIFVDDGRIGLSKDFYTGTGADTTVNISGTTNTHIDIFSVQATWKF